MIPAVKVVLRNEGTSFTREVFSNTDRQYAAYAMPPGQYRITVEHPGVQKLVRTGVELTSANAITVDLRLPLATCSRPWRSLPQRRSWSRTAMVSSLADNEQMIEMPLRSRTFTSLALLGPGAYAGSAGNLTTSPYAMRGDVNNSFTRAVCHANSECVVRRAVLASYECQRGCLPLSGRVRPVAFLHEVDRKLSDVGDCVSDHAVEH